MPSHCGPGWVVLVLVLDVLDVDVLDVEVVDVVESAATVVLVVAEVDDDAAVGATDSGAEDPEGEEHATSNAPATASDVALPLIVCPNTVRTLLAEQRGTTRQLPSRAGAR